MLIVILCIIAALVWYLPVFLKQSKTDRLPGKTSIISVLTGAFPVMIAALILQIAVSFAMRAMEIKGALYNFCDAFISAALIEEGLKFLAAYIIVKKVKTQNKIHYILIFGAVGAGFMITENVMKSGSVLGSVLGAIFAFHIIWQYWMGMYFFEYSQAKQIGDKSKAGKNLTLALGVPFLIHGLNDFIAFVAEPLSAGEITDQEAYILLALMIWIVLMIVFVIITMRKVIKTEKEWKDKTEN